MTEGVYAVVGVPGSGHTAVGLDLAGAFAAEGAETVLVELAPGAPRVLEVLDLGLEFVFRSTVREVLGGSADPADEVTPVQVAHSGVDTLRILPVDDDEDPDAALALAGLAGTVEALRAVYDVVVLAVDGDAVEDLEELAGVADLAVVTAPPEVEAARGASRLAARLDSVGVPVAGAVVTDCDDESELWRAKSRIDREVLAVVPPVEPDVVDPVGERIRRLRRELTDHGGEDPPDAAGGDPPPARSLAALVRGDPTRARIGSGTTTDLDSGATTDLDPGTTTDPDAGATTDPESGSGVVDPDPEPEAGDPDPDAVTPAATGGGGPEGVGTEERGPGAPTGGSSGEDATDGASFEFGELPPADGSGGDAGVDQDGGGGADDSAEGDPGADHLADRISEILDGDEEDRSEDPDGEGSDDPDGGA